MRNFYKNKRKETTVHVKLMNACLSIIMRLLLSLIIYSHFRWFLINIYNTILMKKIKFNCFFFWLFHFSSSATELISRRGVFSRRHYGSTDQVRSLFTSLPNIVHIDTLIDAVFSDFIIIFLSFFTWLMFFPVEKCLRSISCICIRKSISVMWFIDQWTFAVHFLFSNTLRSSNLKHFQFLFNIFYQKQTFFLNIIIRHRIYVW